MEYRAKEPSLRVGSGRVEQHVTRVGRAQKRDRGVSDRSQVTARVQGEPGVVATGPGRLVALVGDVHEVAMDRDELVEGSSRVVDGLWRAVLLARRSLIVAVN